MMLDDTRCGLDASSLHRATSMDISLSKNFCLLSCHRDTSIFIKENFLKVEKVSSYTIEKITSKLLGKRVRFTSDCELFPNFDVKVQVISVSISKNREILFDCRNISNRKKLVIGSNMRNLRFQILS